MKFAYSALEGALPAIVDEVSFWAGWLFWAHVLGVNFFEGSRFGARCLACHWGGGNCWPEWLRVNCCTWRWKLLWCLANILNTSSIFLFVRDYITAPSSSIVVFICFALSWLVCTLFGNSCTLRLFRNSFLGQTIFGQWSVMLWISSFWSSLWIYCNSQKHVLPPVFAMKIERFSPHKY